jgi:hypothetical protein
MQSNMLSHECWYLHIVTSQKNIIVIFSTVTNSNVNFTIYLHYTAGIVGQDSLIVSDCNGLNSPGIESQLGSRFSIPVQTSTGAHTATCAMGIMSQGSKVAGTSLTIPPTGYC